MYILYCAHVLYAVMCTYGVVCMIDKVVFWAWCAMYMFYIWCCVQVVLCTCRACDFVYIWCDVHGMHVVL